jgi:hypothetical protein
MQKLILISLGVVSLSLIILNYTRKDIISNNLEHKNSTLEIDKSNFQTEKTLITLPTASPKKLSITTPQTHKKSEIEKKTLYISYLNYRRSQHNVEEQKRNHYLNHQKELKHIREGGVKSKLQREKRKHEVRFQNQYKSTMMSQIKEKQKKIMEQKRTMERRREQMHSLKERQQLQTKYRGEL